jgi:glycosyltransferase involved in cell wall biosynthesis
VSAPVLILSNALSGGGAEVVARLMVTRIPNASCVLFENNAAITVPGKIVKKAYRQYRAGLLFSALINLWRLMFIQWEKFRLRPAVTISHLEGPNFANILTVMGGRQVLFVHNQISQSYPDDSFRHRVKRYLCRLLYSQASKVVAVSSGVGQELVRSLGVNPAKVLVLPNPIDLQFIEQAAVERYGDYRDTLCRERYLISVASLTRQKNHEQMLRVYEQLIVGLQDRASVKLVLLGDGPLRGELQNLCQQLNLKFFDAQQNGELYSDAHVYFLGFQENPYPLLSCAQLLLMTSRWEGLPIALLEAMGLGIPAVVSNCSEGIWDLWQLSTADRGDLRGEQSIFRAPCGVLIPSVTDESQTIDHWTAEIEKLLHNPIRRELCAKACRDRANDYAIDRVAELWAQHLLTNEGVSS